MQAIRIVVLLGIAAGTLAATAADAVPPAGRQGAAPAAAAPVKGKLCFSKGQPCSATQGLRFDVRPDERARPYVWMSDDSRTIFAGTLAAGADDIDLAAKQPPLRAISLRVLGDASRSWPADVTFTLSESREKEWTWELPAEAAGHDIRIHLPVAEYVLFLQAARHRRFGRRLPSGGDVALGTIELKPLPSIRGRVTQVEKERVTPAIGAQILLDDGKVGGTTNEQGTFSIELSEPVTKEIAIASPGHGTRVMKLQQLTADNDLGEFRLEPGVTLTLQVERPKELDEKVLNVRLLRHDDDFNHLKVTQSTFAAGEKEHEFADLSPGQYYVVLEGTEPLERMLVPVDIGSENLTRKVSIQPFRLQGKVLLGEEPLRKGEVEIMPVGAGQTLFRARLKIEDDGGFGAVLWQTGRLNAFIHGHEEGVLSDESPELGSDPSVWPISFRNRVIRGRIYDADSGAAPGKVRLDVKTTSANGGGSRSTVSVGPNGEYRLLAWRDGTYDLIVSATDYPAATKTIELTEREESKQVDFALRRGVDVKLEFFWSTGQKIRSATIYEGVARDGYHAERQYQTDVAGMLELNVPPDGSRLLYVLPQEGSFAPVRVTATRSSGGEPIRVEIPPGSGKLRVRFKNRQEQAPGGLVTMRYNGEWVPYAITARLPGRTSAGLVEFHSLPAGAYELWAVTLREGQVSPFAPPPHAPIRIGVATGETNVEVSSVLFP
jgi:Carboxypeptidase regulatory-like domain